MRMPVSPPFRGISTAINSRIALICGLGLFLGSGGLGWELHSGNAFAQPKKVAAPGPAKPKAKPQKPAEPPPPVPERHITIAKVNPESRSQALASAAKIDALVEANYARHKVQPNSPLSDEQFVRRAYL